ncbi:YusW family protein [Lentibacillus sp. N15]|uniref:YusW family protein n=1 Tax=Lentibacillus songyuanensis TaxID=3136161 RepID=UPI0031B9D99F
MKRIIPLLAVLLLSFFLAACGTQDDSSNAANDNGNAGSDQDQNQTDNDNNDNGNSNEMNDSADNDQDYMRDKMKDLDYTDFELEVSYGKNKEYEAEIEQDSGTGDVESEIEDSIKDNIDTKGKEAFDKIYPQLKNVTIDRDTKKQDAIDQALKAFDLPSDYTKFEIELTFEDNTKVGFEDKK